MYIPSCTHIHITYIHVIPVLFISSYGAPLTLYFALVSSLFETDDTDNYEYLVNNSIKSLLIGSRSILNGKQTNLAHASKCIKKSACHISKFT